MSFALPSTCRTALRRQLRPELFKALSDPRRLEILARLAVAREPLTVSQTTDCCGVHLSGVSRHLAVLREAGVVSADKQGREVRYRLQVQNLVGALRGLADAIEDCCTTAGCCGVPKKGTTP